MGPGTLIGQVLERWNQIPRSRQVALGGILAGAIVVFYFILTMSSEPNLVTAYTGLAPEESAAMVDQLEKDGIPYQLGGGGSTISVPANQVATVRIKLAAAGLGKGGGIGLEIFDKTNFGATDFVQQVNFVRGMEGELARSIDTLDGVRSSRVHVVIPKDAIFKEDQKNATASVLVAMKPGHNLGDDQVKGITNLVTNSIEGLKTGGVTIIDEHGHVLFDGASQDGAFSSGGTASQMGLQRQYEVALQRDVESTLSKVVGPGRSAVTVRAHLNFDKVQQSEDKFAPGAQAIARSTTSTTETYSGAGGPGTGAIPGASANGGGAANAVNNAAATGNNNYQRTETTSNNEINKTTTTTVKAPGTVDRLSVSVVLDDSVTAAQEASITSTVAAAVGLDQVRGDTLSVARLPFDASVKDDLSAPSGDPMAQYLSYLKLLVPMLAIVLAFVLVTLLLKSLAKRQSAFPVPGYQATVLAGATALGAGGGQALGPGMSLPALEAAPDPIEERVMKLADGNPRAVADVVQTWMREEER
jgi:flagellar M-ring protein FliF